MRGEFIDLNGERIYYYAAGSRGAGDPILLIHGFPASGHVWTDVVPKLPAGHRVIVVDLLGFGRSDAPKAADYGVAAHGRRLIALLDDLRIDRACIVGHGIGGAIAMWAALNAGGRVSRLGLIASATVEGWFFHPHPIERRTRTLGLMLPTWGWLPLARRAIAATFVDQERGLRSAEMYLRVFATRDGARVLRRHIQALTDGQIGDVARRTTELRIPVASLLSGRRRFSPEEIPSDVAATIAELLAR